MTTLFLSLGNDDERRVLAMRETSMGQLRRWLAQPDLEEGLRAELRGWSGNGRPAQASRRPPMR